MLPLHNLSLALHNAGNVAASLRTHADAASKVAEVLTSFAAMPKPASLDTEALAQALLPLGLSLVHTDVLRKALGVVKTADGKDREEYELLASLEQALELSIAGKAQDGIDL